MGNLAYLKTSLWMLLIAAILAAVALVIYQVRKAGSSLGSTLKSVKDWISPPDPVMPKQLQDFVNEAVNQPGGYTPWKPAEEIDEGDNPSWLYK